MSALSYELAPPAPSHASECVPPETKAGHHSLAGEGAGEPIRTTGEKVWHSVNFVVLAVPLAHRSREGGGLLPVHN